MKNLFVKIQELKLIRNISKHEQIVQGIINAIDSKVLIVNAPLPSLATMNRQLGFAEKTIVKAYAELKSRGIIESKPRRGYYVIDNRTKQVVRVMLLMYAFGMIQKTFYNAFKIGLGENVRIDTFFHHNNLSVFKNFISDNLDKYGVFVVAPIHHPEVVTLLQLIPSDKLLIIDRFEYIGKNYSYVSQDFKTHTNLALEKIKGAVKNFKQIILFYRIDTDYPKGILQAFKNFIKANSITGSVEPFYMPNTLKKNTLYFTINDIDLWEILQDCQKNNFELGKDIGILSCDETPAKKIVLGGITTISTDFRLMAQKSAEYVLNRIPIKEIIPGELIRRKSL